MHFVGEVCVPPQKISIKLGNTPLMLFEIIFKFNQIFEKKQNPSARK